MVLRSTFVLASLLAAAPAFAETLSAEQARHFVAGKHFSFNCFEGSTGSGRIMSDGSVAGVIKMRGEGPIRFIHMPPGTLFAKDDRICSFVKGALFNPCFNLTKTSEKSFRGAVSGFGFAYCDFVRGGRETMQASIVPDITSSTRGSIRRSRKPTHEQPAAAPTQAVTSAPLAPLEQTGMRSSIQP